MANLASLTLLFVFLSIGYGVDIICQQNQDCIIDCSTTHCSGENATINATNANSLTVLCNGVETCAYSTIYCPISNGSICNIQCIGDSNCKEFNLYAEYNNISIECNGKSACKYAKIRATYATSYNMICFNDISPVYWNTPCGTDVGFVIFNYAQQVNIQCLTQYACYFAQWYGRYVKGDVTLSCIGDNSCHAIDIWCPASTVNQCKISGQGAECFAYAQVNSEGVAVNDYLDLTCVDASNINCDDLRVSCNGQSMTWVTAQYDTVNNEYACSNAAHSCCPWIPGTDSPTIVTISPTLMPSNSPSHSTQMPSAIPTSTPTTRPSIPPSTNPTTFPTHGPTEITDVPSTAPTESSMSPTENIEVESTIITYAGRGNRVFNGFYIIVAVYIGLNYV
eukprot:523925_1